MTLQSIFFSFFFQKIIDRREKSKVLLRVGSFLSFCEGQNFYPRCAALWTKFFGKIFSISFFSQGFFLFLYFKNQNTKTFFEFKKKKIL
jgi:hypothetical protein